MHLLRKTTVITTNDYKVILHSWSCLVGLFRHVRRYTCELKIRNVFLQTSKNVLLARLQTRRALIFSRVCLSVCVCVCVSDWHFYPSTLTDFDETWSRGPYSDLVCPRP